MQELIFDYEGITSCPMNETATRLDCVFCRYHKENGDHHYFCIYQDVYPEPMELDLIQKGD